MLAVAAQEGYFDLIELSYGYGYYWLWSKHVGEPKSAENVVCEAIRTWKIELNLEQYVEDVNCDRTPYR